MRKCKNKFWGLLAVVFIAMSVIFAFSASAADAVEENEQQQVEEEQQQQEITEAPAIEETQAPQNQEQEQQLAQDDNNQNNENDIEVYAQEYTDAPQEKKDELPQVASEKVVEATTVKLPDVKVSDTTLVGGVIAWLCVAVGIAVIAGVLVSKRTRRKK